MSVDRPSSRWSSERGKYRPFSTTTTLYPASAIRAATTDPPAPDPTITASASIWIFLEFFATCNKSSLCRIMRIDRLNHPSFTLIPSIHPSPMRIHNKQKQSYPILVSEINGVNLIIIYVLTVVLTPSFCNCAVICPGL